MNDHDVIVSGSFNTRDLGGYNTNNGKLAMHKTYRSGNMGQVDEAGIETLKKLGVSRVIDLRSQKERDTEPDPFSSEDGIELIAISLFDDLNPNQKTKSNVLLDLYIHALKTQGPVFVKVLQHIAESRDAVMFHCTAGKDRTGLIAALLLALSGVSKDDIINDYAMTADRLGPLLQTIEKTAKSFNFSKEDYMPMLECNPENMIKALDWIDTNFNSVENYVKSHGFTGEDLTRLRERWCLNK